MNTCIFCLEASSPLFYNVKCRCNYYFHLECYQAYRTKTVCPLCRANVGELWLDYPMDPLPPSAPSANLLEISFPIQVLQQSQQQPQQSQQQPQQSQQQQQSQQPVQPIQYIIRGLCLGIMVVAFLSIIYAVYRHLSA